MANQKKLKFFVFAGESSGDLHGAPLIRALKKLYPEAIFSGVGGPFMRSEGLKCVEKMESFKVMGFTDVIRALPQLTGHFYRLRDYILAEKPDAAIFIDYPGFNLRLEEALRKKGFEGKLIHYICPSVWAWGKGRIPKMAANLDLLLTIYPFESGIFSQTRLDVKYIGNPLIDKISHYNYQNNWKKRVGISGNQPIIAIFPGSREGEIKRNFPVQIEAMKMLKKVFPQAIFAISCIENSFKEKIRDIISTSNFRVNQDVFLVPSEFNYELMRDSHTAIAKSGTVTLELALHNRPTVVLYQLSKLNRFIAKYILRLNLPHYCIVNILAQKAIFPELIASGVNPKALYEHVKDLFQEGVIRQNCLSGCKEIHHILSATTVNENAAREISKLLKTKKGTPNSEARQ